MKDKSLRKSWMIISNALVFTVLVFGPIETFYVNRAEFLFDLQTVLMPIIAIAVVGAVFFSALYFLLPYKVKYIAGAIIFAVLFACYLQTNILNPDFGALGALKIEWSQYQERAYMNASIWTVLLLGAVLAVFKLKQRFMKIASIVSAFLIVMQTASLAVMLINCFTTPAYTGETAKAVLSNEGIFELGNAEGSAIVFIVDTFDDEYYDSAVEAKPEVQQIFDGFTRFTNNSGSYSKTIGAVTYMISGIHNYNEVPYAVYAEQAFSDSDLLNTLKEQHYDVRAFTDTTPAVDAALSHYVNNATQDAVKVTNSWPLTMNLMQLSAFRQAPEALKEALYIEGSSFNAVMNANSVSTQWIADDATFYQKLCEQGITTVDHMKTFRIIHLNGVHAPHYLTADARRSASEVTSLENTFGILKILETYFEGMKAAGVYDQTTIMVIADHSRMLDGDVLTLIKPPYDSGPMQVSNSPVSHTDIHNTLFACMNLPEVPYGENMFTVAENAQRERMFYMYDIGLQWDYVDWLPPLWEMKIGHDIYEPYHTGNVYVNGEKQSYKDYAPMVTLGQKYAYEDMEDYFTLGFFTWGSVSDGFLWGNMQRGQMFFKVTEVPEKGVDVVLDLLTWLPGKPMEMTVQTLDGVELFHAVYENAADPQVRIHVPSYVFDQNNLAVLQFKFPNAYYDRDNHRHMNFGYYSFTVEESGN